jgi:hypothetical protein
VAGAAADVLVERVTAVKHAVGEVARNRSDATVRWVPRPRGVRTGLNREGLTLWVGVL